MTATYRPQLHTLTCRTCGATFTTLYADADNQCDECWFAAWDAWWQQYNATFTAKETAA